MVSVETIHLASTLVMVGLILFVQIVHYPLMARVGADGFEAYEAGHTFRTGLLVVPLMITELGSAIWIAAMPAAAEGRLLAVIWTSTALLQAPAHRRLSAGFDATVHRKLVRTNWIRTVSWMGRIPVAFALLPW